MLSARLMQRYQAASTLRSDQTMLNSSGVGAILSLDAALSRYVTIASMKSKITVYDCGY